MVWGGSWSGGGLARGSRRQDGEASSGQPSLRRPPCDPKEGTLSAVTCAIPVPQHRSLQATRPSGREAGRDRAWTPRGELGPFPGRCCAREREKAAWTGLPRPRPVSPEGKTRIRAARGGPRPDAVHVLPSLGGAVYRGAVGRDRLGDFARSSPTRPTAKPGRTTISTRSTLPALPATPTHDADLARRQHPSSGGDPSPLHQHQQAPPLALPAPALATTRRSQRLPAGASPLPPSNDAPLQLLFGRRP